MIQRLPAGDPLVVDPMNGSGTTTVAAQKSGADSIGIELNPAVAMMSRAKDSSLYGMCDWEELLGRVVQKAQTVANHLQETGVEWVHPAHLADLRRIQRAIDACVNESGRGIDVRLKSAIKPAIPFSSVSPRDLLNAALLRTVRQFSRARESKNPTWLKKNELRRRSHKDPLSSFCATVREMLCDL
jgi:hypothetical protein